jgi:hypothetical protein
MLAHINWNTFNGTSDAEFSNQNFLLRTQQSLTIQCVCCKPLNPQELTSACDDAEMVDYAAV